MSNMFKKVVELVSALVSIAFVVCAMIMTGIMLYGIAKIGPAVFELI